MTALDVDAPAPIARRSVWGRLYHGETRIDFYRRRWWGIAVSVLLVVITVVSLFTRQLNLGIDFEGGVAWEVPVANGVTVDTVDQVLTDNGIDFGDAKVRTLTSTDGQRINVQVGDQSIEQRQAVQAALAEAAGVDVEEVSVTSVSSTWGSTITEKAVRALIVFVVLVALFITWRFEWRMAVAAIVAMAHDVLISVGVYSLFGFEVTPATVVAFLTILGFSLYDTIVVFDKVKENEAHFSTARVPYADVLNVSMNQVLMRSLNTSLAAVLPVLSLLVLGSGVMGAVTLREFALALLVGLVTGSYSSIYIAAPVLAILKERSPRYRGQRSTHATGDELERLVHGEMPTRRDSGRAARRRRAAPSSPDDERDATSGAPALRPTPDEPAAALTHPPRPRKQRRR